MERWTRPSPDALMFTTMKKLTVHFARVRGDTRASIVRYVKVIGSLSADFEIGLTLMTTRMLTVRYAKALGAFTETGARPAMVKDRWSDATLSALTCVTTKWSRARCAANEASNQTAQSVAVNIR